MTEFYDQIICETNTDYSIIIEDDGKVAYAYLFKETDIIIKSEAELEINWSFLNNGELESVLIYIRSKLISKLTFGSKPGWSTCVSKSGPLALDGKV